MQQGLPLLTGCKLVRSLQRTFFLTWMTGQMPFTGNQPSFFNASSLQAAAIEKSSSQDTFPVGILGLWANSHHKQDSLSFLSCLPFLLNSISFHVSQSIGSLTQSACASGSAWLAW